MSGILVIALALGFIVLVLSIWMIMTVERNKPKTLRDYGSLREYLGDEKYEHMKKHIQDYRKIREQENAKACEDFDNYLDRHNTPRARRRGQRHSGGHGMTNDPAIVAGVLYGSSGGSGGGCGSSSGSSGGFGGGGCD